MSEASLNVVDMDNSIDFYTTILGMLLKRKDKWWSALDCGGVSVGQPVAT